MLVTFSPIVIKIFLRLGYRAFDSPFVFYIGCLHEFTSLSCLQRAFILINEIIHYVMVWCSIWSLLPTTIWFIWEIFFLVDRRILLDIWCLRLMFSLWRCSIFFSLYMCLVSFCLAMRSHIAIVGACFMRGRNFIKNCNILYLLTHYCTDVFLILILRIHIFFLILLIFWTILWVVVRSWSLLFFTRFLLTDGWYRSVHIRSW